MVDNITVDEGTGKTVATDERTVGGSTVHIQRVYEIGASAIANGHVTVSNSAGNIVSARDTRKRLVVVNYQTVPIYVGVATVTTSNGVRVDPGGVIELHITSALQGITSAAYTAAGEDDKVHYWEEYD